LRWGPLLLAVTLLVAACSSGGAGEPLARERSSTTTAPPTTTTTRRATTSTTELPPSWPPLPQRSDARALVTPAGLVVPVLGVQGDAYVVRTPCSRQALVRGGTPLTAAHVVLDPGHGGDETGAAGDADGDGTAELPEKVPTLIVAQKVKALLEKRGATVVLTRTADYRVTLQTRAEIATRLEPLAFVSIHFNGGPDGPFPKPGSETYYQIASADSKRLAGVLYTEVVGALSPYHVTWVADRDAGAKYRLSSSGGDYYGILRRSAGVAAALAELAFIGNPPEAALIARPDVQDVMAKAVADGIERFVRGEPGSGYVDPYPRTEPAGPGGGTSGCVDPPL
jgi:N-acetylmuramoyl-L-alanine amidase